VTFLGNCFKQARHEKDAIFVVGGCAAEQLEDDMMGRSHAAVRGRHAEVSVEKRQGAVFDVFAPI
jgi:hypothetical protein